MISAEPLLTRGAKILMESLNPQGFRFSVVERSSGSGGDFAIGEFVNGDRAIRLWVRFELGSVTYRKGAIERSHPEIMQCLGLEEEAAYPGFGGGDPENGFHHLCLDFGHLDCFFQNEGQGFEHKMKSYVYERKVSGLTALRRINRKA